jgi:hypothetical protein
MQTIVTIVFMTAFGGIAAYSVYKTVKNFIAKKNGQNASPANDKKNNNRGKGNKNGTSTN